MANLSFKLDGAKDSANNDAGRVVISNSSPVVANRVLASTTVAVAGLTTIGAAINVSDFSRIKVVIDNSDDTGSAAILFDAFQIQASVDGGSNFETLFSAASDYTSPKGILVGASGNLTVLAADATGWFILDVGGLDQIRVQASADTTQSVGVTGTWSAN